jgi:chromate transporter
MGKMNASVPRVHILIQPPIYMKSTDLIGAMVPVVFARFLKMGCIAFGGPVAHLGFFQEEFVQRRQWLTEAEYADLVALCQFLPGPASTQIAFAIGLKQAGLPGAFAAWLGFSLPAVVLMIGFALGLAALGNIEHAGWIIGLKLAAVAVVANAIWTMAAKLCPDRARALMAIGSAAFLMVMTSGVWQVIVILMGAVAGWMLFHSAEVRPVHERGKPSSPRAWLFLVLFVVFLVGLPVVSRLSQSPSLAAIEGFYRTGSLVFGGGHVMLPLLERVTVEPGWIDQATFLAGYGAAQAIPGPLFAFTGFLGVNMTQGTGGIMGGLLAILAFIMPSWLLVLGFVPYWDRLRQFSGVRAAMMGTNAVVVGLLLAAFFNPILSTAVTGADRLAFALVAFGMLRFARIPPWALVTGSAGVGALIF